MPCKAAVVTVTLNTVIKRHNGFQRAVDHQKGLVGPVCSFALFLGPIIIHMTKHTHIYS